MWKGIDIVRKVILFSSALIFGVALVFLVYGQQGQAQEASIIGADGTFDDYNKVVEGFFGYIAQGKTDGAVDFIFKNSPDDVNELKAQLQRLNPLTGKYIGHEKLLEKDLAGRLVYVSYLVRYEHQPMRFIFEFYKPGDRWQTFEFKFDDKLGDDLGSDALDKLTKMVKHG